MVARLFRHLEAELLDFLRPRAATHATPFVLVVDEDASGDHDTSIPVLGGFGRAVHTTQKTQPPEGYCERTLHPVAQSNGTQLRSDRVETGAMSFVVKPLAVGVRVRIKQPSIQIADEYGIVTRLDARGACVKLDSGREFLVEPAMLERACSGFDRSLVSLHSVSPLLYGTHTGAWLRRNFLLARTSRDTPSSPTVRSRS